MNVLGKQWLSMLALLVTAPAAMSASLVGEWVSQGHAARIDVATCAEDGERFCGTIAWLWESADENGAPPRDRNNPSEALRAMPLVGLVLLRGLRASGPDTWDDGTIYDPESGRTYDARVRLRTQDLLEVRGCLLFVCRTQLWRRSSSMCRG